MRIFYVTDGVHLAGSQIVTLLHVAGLRRLGYDARFLFVRPEGEAVFAPQFPKGLEAPWQVDASDLTADDIAVCNELFGPAAAAVAKTPARRALLIQAPFYLFTAFVDMDAIREWGCEAIIASSGFGAGMLVRLGWDRGLQVVKPPIDPVFAAVNAGPRQLRISLMTRRRVHEARLIRGILRSTRPDLNEVGWVEIANLPRAQAAWIMAENEIFLSLGHLEGLGLPPLEAMSAGALVVGFHGEGGKDFASPENGDWFDDGQHFEIAERLAQRIDELKAGETFEARRAAGRATAAAYSESAFMTQLQKAWTSIAGPPTSPAS